MRPDEGRGRPALDILLPLASVAVRLLAMALCAAAAATVLSLVSGAVLPSPGSLDQTFDRLGMSMAVGIVLGIALGGVLSHRFARGTYLPVERVGFAVAAAVPLLILAGIIAVAW